MKTNGQILDYAIRSINRYDKFKEGEKVGDCDMCDFIPVINKETDCPSCPFYSRAKELNCCNSDTPLDDVGSYARGYGRDIKKWQDELIVRVTAWCEKFYPRFTIERK